MTGLISFFKISFLSIAILVYMVLCLPLYPVMMLSPQKYRYVNARIVSLFSKFFLRMLGFNIQVEGTTPQKHKNHLVVSNHLSYLDVLIVSAHFPGCFVTSQEIRQTPFLGHITILAGCLFVERRSRHFLKKETHNITQALRNGLNVIIFPEGTSTNGSSVLRFRRPLFQAALDSQTAVLPVSISYTHLNGRPVTQANRDRIFWYDDMAFGPHFAGLAAVSSVKVNLFVNPPVYPAGPDTCAELSVKSHNAVARSYLPV